MWIFIILFKVIAKSCRFLIFSLNSNKLDNFIYKIQPTLIPINTFSKKKKNLLIITITIYLINIKTKS